MTRTCNLWSLAFLLVPSMIATPLDAQNVENVRYEAKKNKIFIHFDIACNADTSAYNVFIFPSFDGGRSFLNRLTEVEGDVRSVRCGKDKVIIWDYKEEKFDINRYFILDVRAQKPMDYHGEILVIADVMPTYPGGIDALYKAIYDNLKYPPELKEKGIEGKAIIRFAVTTEGRVDHVSVVKGVDSLLDAEAVRIIKGLSGWSPGMMGETKVNVWYSIPVTFQSKDTSGKVYTTADIMPSFPGGEEAAYHFIFENIVYPKEAKDKGIVGKVIVKFIVTSEGKLDSISVAKSVHPLLDAEAVRLIREMPVWIPAESGGKKINVWYTFPVTFQIR